MTRAAAAIAEGRQDQRVDSPLARRDRPTRRRLPHDDRLPEPDGRAADAIARGDLTRRLRPLSPHDVLGTAFERMIRELARDRRRVAGRDAQPLQRRGAQIWPRRRSRRRGRPSSRRRSPRRPPPWTRYAPPPSRRWRWRKWSPRRRIRRTGWPMMGSSAVRDATAVMADIRERVQSIAENILALSEQSQQIGEIIATVNDLADQSNLLALNAAIEASAGRASRARASASWRRRSAPWRKARRRRPRRSARSSPISSAPPTRR